MANPSFSKRQAALNQRLEALCSRAEKEDLPIIVEEVWGFGSFFRLKERPKDLDLGVKYSDFHPLWQKFNDVIEKVLSARWESTTSYPSPGDALREELSKSNDGAVLWSTFSAWIEGLTWDAMARGIIPEEAYNWDIVTRRMLTRNLPGAKVMTFAKVGEKFHLATEAVLLIWSRSKPDVKSNLLVAFSPKSMKDNMVVELAGFDEQLSAVKFELDVKTRLYKSLIPLPPEAFPPEDDNRAWHEWLVSRAKELVPPKDGERAKKLFEGPSPFAEEAASPKRVDDGAAYRNMELRDLQEATERKRAEMKDGHREIEVVKALLDAVVDWKSRRLDRDTYHARYTIEVWLAQRALKNSHKKIVDEEQIRQILRRHDLPEGRILKRMGFRGHYKLPEGDEEATEIKLSNAKFEAQHNLSKVVRNEVRKLNERLNVWVEVGDNLRPSFVNLAYHVLKGNRDKKAGTLLKWCRSRGFKVEERPWATYAELRIPVRGSKDAGEIASRVNKALSVGSPTSKSSKSLFHPNH